MREWAVTATLRGGEILSRTFLAGNADRAIELARDVILYDQIDRGMSEETAEQFADAAKIIASPMGVNRIKNRKGD